MLTALKSAFFLLLLLSPGFARATPESDFLQAANVIPAKLRSEGVSRVGSLGLRDWQKFSAGVEVVFVSSLKIPNRDSVNTSRQSAGWKKSDGKRLVFVSQKSWQAAKPKVRNVLALHELLCLKGFDDRNYNISMALYFLSQYGAPIDFDLRAFPPRLRAIVHELESGPGYVMASEGGSTLVGGGGDTFTILVKTSSLDKAGKALVKARTAAEREAALESATWAISYNMEVGY